MESQATQILLIDIKFPGHVAKQVLLNSEVGALQLVQFSGTIEHVAQIL